MRLAIKVFFVLAFLVLNIYLLMPIGNRGVSWAEAGLAIIPAAFVSFICFLLLLAGVGAKDRSQSRASRWWASALVWSLLVGGIVTYFTTSNYQDNMSSVMNERMDRNGGRSDTSLEEAYARYDQMGIMYGWTTLGFAGFSLVGLIISLAMKKKVQDTAP